MPCRHWLARRSGALDEAAETSLEWTVGEGDGQRFIAWAPMAGWHIVTLAWWSNGYLGVCDRRFSVFTPATRRFDLFPTGQVRNLLH
jgi:hypothetical protein